MANNIRIKRSSVPGKVPDLENLALGELAINTYDGRLYTKQDTTSTGGVVSITQIGGALSTNSSLLGTGTALSPLSVVKWSSPITLTLTGDVTGSVSFDGSGNVSLSTSAIISDIVTVAKTLTLTTDWQDVGINGTDLATGSYLIQLFANDASAGGTNVNEYYTGSMSWYAGVTTSGGEMPTDEITLHRAGAGADGSLYLRTYRSPTGSLKLQVYANQPNASAANYVFKFKRLI